MTLTGDKGKSCWCWLLIAALMVGSWCNAYESPKPRAKIPQHAKAWQKEKKDDIRRVFLWRFVGEAEQGSIDDVLGEEDDILGAVDEGGPDGGMPAGDEAPEPRLQGTAQRIDGGGRFGGGLQLDGEGWVNTRVDLGQYVDREKGLTLDFWFRAPKKVERSSYLFALPDTTGSILYAAQLIPDERIVLRHKNKELFSIPLVPTNQRWHHLAFLMRVEARHLRVKLQVDGDSAEKMLEDGGQTLSERLGKTLYVGGMDKGPGLRGVIDDVRLTKGVKYFYPWKLGAQEVDGRKVRDIKPPYFTPMNLKTRFRCDGDLKPDAFEGFSLRGKTSEQHFAPGLKGQALDLSRIDETGFRLNGFHVVPEKKATVEFWMRPLDWHNFYLGDFRGTDVDTLRLLTLKSQEAASYLPTKSVFVRKGRAHKYGKHKWEKIHPGTWTHVLISIGSDGRSRVYLNGKPQTFAQVGYRTSGHPRVEKVLEQWRKRTDGDDVDDTWGWTFEQSPTLIDELSIYSGAMSADEAWNAYARWMSPGIAELESLPLFRVTFDYFAHSWDMKEKLAIELTCLPTSKGLPVAVDVRVTNTDGDVMFSVEKQKLDENGRTTVTVGKKFPFGHYPVTIRSRGQDGKVLGEKTVKYEREKPDWYGNTLGESHAVPEPWTPIKVDGRELEVIGRHITLGETGLPAAITTNDEGVLAGPIRIYTQVQGKRQSLSGQSAKVTLQRDDRVEWESTLAGKKVQASLDAWMEFDGLIYCNLTLTSRSGDVELEALDVDFPMNSKVTTQLLANGGGNNFRASWIARYIPAGDGSVWNSLEKPYKRFQRANGFSNYMPHIWLGRDEVGLYFGAENDKGWTVGAKKPAQEIVRDDDSVTFRMNVVREPIEIAEKGHQFHFVILPTPAKPEPSDWRLQMTEGGVNFASVDSFGGFDMKTNPDDPQANDNFRMEPHSWDYAEKMSQKGRKKQGRCILYADASWPRPGEKFEDWNHDLWSGTGRIAWTPELQDYAVWAINEYLERGLIDGVYWDDVSVGYTNSLASTAYKHPDSKSGRRPGFTMLAMRRVNLRLWRLFEAAGKEPCIWTHMTVCYEVPIFSFCRYLVNGEFTTGIKLGKKRDAMDFWSPEKLRVLGSSETWGTGLSYVTTLPREAPDTDAAKQWFYPQNRTQDALFATNDIMMLSGALQRKMVEEEVFRGEVDAFPWWESEEVLEVDAPEKADVRASVYIKDNRAIIFVANYDRGEAYDVTVNIGQLYPDAGSLEWRDLDPGLKPPKAVAASEDEMKELETKTPGLMDDDESGEMSDEDFKNVLEGTTKKQREQQKLKMRTRENKASVRVRPRDYRVLEVRPR